MPGRRSSDDPKWKLTKAAVDKRDKRRCQFDRCLLAKEAHSLRNGGPTTLDRAHIFAASTWPEQIYNTKNIVTLKRFLHRRLDDYQSPLDGTPISHNERMWWFYRIYTKSHLHYDENEDYELKLKTEIF